MIKIVAVDGYPLNSGDLSWDRIESLGDLTVYDRTDYGDLVERCKPAEVILTNKVPFNKAVLDQLPKLKLLVVTATGYNMIDTHAAAENGISVCNVPDYGTDSVAQHTFSLILELTNKVGRHSDSVTQGDWESCTDFCYTLNPLMELSGKTLGLVGFGHIGLRTAEIARAFGMEVIYHTPSIKNTQIARYVELKDLFSSSDIISLHLPLKDDNKEFVNGDLLRLMKNTALLINTARGALIQEQDLADALNEERIAGAGLDVLSSEPPKSTNPLLRAKNCLITPHIAWMSKEARVRIMEIVYQNIEAYLKNNLINKVN